MSIYQLPVALTDQHNQAVKLDRWAGHPVVITLIYTGCTAACPLTIAALQGIDAALTPATRAETRYLLVSMDPEHDTPEALAALAVEHHLDDRWSLVRADEAGVRQIAAVLGVRYRKLDDGSFNHSTVLTLLDGQGAVQARIDGLGEPHDALVARANALVSPPPP